MPKITHTTLMYTDLSELNEIPSEYLEPYLVKFMSYIIESVGCGWKKPAEARAQLKGIESFVSLFGGIHSRMAMMNQYFNFVNLKDEDMIKICKESCDKI